MAIFDPQFRDTFVHTISYKVPTTAGTYGEGSTSSPTTAAARVEAVDEELSSGTGTERGTGYVIYTEAPITAGSFVWLPGVTVSTANARKVRSVVKHWNAFDGSVSHYEVTV